MAGKKKPPSPHLPPRHCIIPFRAPPSKKPSELYRSDFSTRLINDPKFDYWNYYRFRVKFQRDKYTEDLNSNSASVAPKSADERKGDGSAEIGSCCVWWEGFLDALPLARRTGQTTVNKWAPICYIIPINDMVNRPLKKMFQKSPKKNSAIRPSNLICCGWI